MVLTNKSEKNKKRKVMSEITLPDELVCSSIIPLISMKDIARSSLVSHTWLRYWRNTPILTFDDRSSIDKMIRTSRYHSMSTYSQTLSDCRTSFITRVNNVLTNHIGCTVEEFRVVYFLNNFSKVSIDWWVVWAFSKHVQRLTLDFTIPLVFYGTPDEEKHSYVLDRTLCNTTTKLYLTTLCLKYVNFDAFTIQYLLDGCASTLENLCIENSRYLKSVTATASLTSLKSLMVVRCPQLESVDIQAPNLVSLTYHSDCHLVSMTVFNIKNASKLCYVDIAILDEECFLFVLRSLFKYFSHLEHLKLLWYTHRTKNLVLDKYPVLANLKRLGLHVHESRCHRTLDAWVPFIGACPRVEHLTLQVVARLTAVPPKNVYQDNCPLSCLKTFEIMSFQGYNLDLDIANFVVKNGINLQEVILHPINLWGRPLNLEAPFARVGFKLPPHVKLVIVN